MAGLGAQNRLNNAPRPPAFLDPLFSTDDCFYYSVPRFFETNHPSTSWLLKRILSGDAKSLQRKLTINPNMLCNQYYQLLDDPAMYIGDKPAGAPMFHSKCLLYLTALGMCLYFKSLDLVNLLLNFRTVYNEPVVSPDEAQFASHLQDTTAGDFHAFLPFIVMMRRQFFEASVPLQLNGWRPDWPFAMPLRRRYERRVMYCRDWLDAALGMLSCRPVYPITALVLSITAYPNYSFSRFPAEAVWPKGEPSNKAKKPKDDTVDLEVYARHGLLPIGDQPLSVPLVGAKSLVEICETYDRLKQAQHKARRVLALLREATAAGLSTKVLLMQAQDCLTESGSSDAQVRNDSNMSNLGTPDTLQCQPETESEAELGRQPRLDSNNHAKVQVPMEELPHCSEPLRILMFALTKDKSGSSLPLCLDAVGAYVRRNYFSCVNQLPVAHGRNRDMRNVVTCLLNLIAREQMAIDTIVARLRAGDKRLRALEAVKQLHTCTIAKISGLMTSILMSSKQIVHFITTKEFPPYPESSVDFKFDWHLKSQMTSLRYDVVCHVNGCRDSWKYLTKEMLDEMVRISAVQLHLKVGRPPTKAC